ncbi:hypothetical protein C8J57DRAFT_1714135 [Mycena rebaudengoi]|nr:hypothetical protein C8J57DRAFT_1714135 [Mycena rebaudengoi]
MSQAVTEPAAQSGVLLGTPEPERMEFPAAWLEPIIDRYVIDTAHWNKEPAPETDPPQRTHFSVEWSKFYGTDFLTPWNYGVEIAGLIIRLYFDIPGCIIPVAYISDYPVETFVFTIAGRPDVEGKKDFYIFNFDPLLSENEVHLLRPAFSSVADFHLNRRSDQLVSVVPRPDREEETLEALIKCGFKKALKRTVYEFSDSDDSDN